MTGGAVHIGFLGSQEYAADHPAAMSNSAFVSSLYQEMLGRAGEPAGMAGWTNALNAGETRADVVVGFADSAEAQQHWSATTSQGVFAYNPEAAIVREVYATGFDREAEAGGLSGWTQLLENGLSLHDFGVDIVNSAEFAADHANQSNAAFVASLYEGGLGRAPEPQGAAFWTGKLDSGAMTRGSVVIGIATSQEGSQHLTWSV